VERQKPDRKIRCLLNLKKLPTRFRALSRTFSSTHGSPHCCSFEYHWSTYPRGPCPQRVRRNKPTESRNKNRITCKYAIPPLSIRERPLRSRESLINQCSRCQRKNRRRNRGDKEDSREAEKFESSKRRSRAGDRYSRRPPGKSA